jgi:hypothetical protein
MTQPMNLGGLSASTPNLFMSERGIRNEPSSGKPALRRDNFLVNSTSSFDRV